VLYVSAARDATTTPPQHRITNDTEPSNDRRTQMRKKHIITAGAATALALAVAGPASASVTVNPETGIGFVGKGDVQTAMGWNNDVLQKNAANVTFKSSQAASQAMTQFAEQAGKQAGSQTGTQSGTQSATQAGTQTVLETLSCLKDNGSTAQRSRLGTRDGERVGTRTATRDASRVGTRYGYRDGSRTGTRAGVINGTIAGEINGDPRKGQTQFTGFNLKGYSSQSPFAATGDVKWDAPTFGVYEWSSYEFANWTYGDWSSDAEYEFGDYTFSGTTTWQDWESEANANPDGVCNDGELNHVVPGSVKDVITVVSTIDGDVTEGAIRPNVALDGEITDGAIKYGPEESGAITKSGVLTLSYGLSKPLIK
jgi:hypothetical protein